MTTEGQHSMHPALDVVRSQLLLDVAEENRRLEEEIGRLHDSCDFLGGIELRLGSSRVISASLSRGIVVNDYHGLPCLYVPIDAPPMPLSCFRSGKASLSGQGIGSLPGISDPILTLGDDGALRMKILLSERNVVEGRIGCLDDEDLASFEDGTYEKDLLDYLTTGRGRLRNPDAISFEADMIYMIISDDLRESIRVLGPLATFADETTVMSCCEPLPVEPGVDCVECPPPSTCDESRLDIVNTLGCDDLQLFEENRKLKILRHRLSKIEERIGSVELYHDLQRTRLSFEDGEYVEYPNEGKKWRISLKSDGKYLPIVANNLHLLEISVSGVSSDLKSMLIHIDEDSGLRMFRGTFGNAANIFGYFDMGSATEIMDDGVFLDRAQGFSSGVQFLHPSR